VQQPQEKQDDSANRKARISKACLCRCTGTKTGPRTASLNRVDKITDDRAVEPYSSKASGSSGDEGKSASADQPMRVDVDDREQTAGSSLGGVNH
jgi:hypothetical protein